MKINLFTSFYKDANPQRYEELVFCFKKNILAGFDTIFLYEESREIETLATELFLQHRGTNNPTKLHTKRQEARATFSDYFSVMAREEYANSINVLSNSDIFFENLDSIEKYFNNLQEKSTCLALSRWDYFPDGTSAHHDQNAPY
jgi:hypothetical protein